MAKVEFTHFQLDEEVKSISGHMVFQDEKRLQFEGREILYYKGYSVTDSSCCGNGACLFTYVPGFISKWHKGEDNEGNPVSEVEPITDNELKKRLTRLIIDSETCTQVNFLEN